MATKIKQKKQLQESRRNVPISDEDWDQVQEAARKRDISASCFVRFAVKEKLQRDFPAIPTPTSLNYHKAKSSPRLTSV